MDFLEFCWGGVAGGEEFGAEGGGVVLVFAGLVGAAVVGGVDAAVAGDEVDLLNRHPCRLATLREVDDIARDQVLAEKADLLEDRRAEERRARENPPERRGLHEFRLLGRVGRAEVLQFRHDNLRRRIAFHLVHEPPQGTRAHHIVAVVKEDKVSRDDFQRLILGTNRSLRHLVAQNAATERLGERARTVRRAVVNQDQFKVNALGFQRVNGLFQIFRPILAGDDDGAFHSSWIF